MLRHITRSPTLQRQLPYIERPYCEAHPRRKSMTAPPDNGTFVKPLKQCFVRNPRTMPMTRLMLTMLAGWAGNGGTLSTTQGIIANKLGRSTRQTIRYLKDAMEEGYLLYSRTKDRIGRYTGIKIWLNFPAIRHEYRRKKLQKSAEKLDMTYESDTKDKSILNREVDPEFRKKIVDICKRNNIKLPVLPA